MNHLIAHNNNWYKLIFHVYIICYFSRGCRGVIKALSNHWPMIQQIHHSMPMIVSKFASIGAFCYPAYSHSLLACLSCYYGVHSHSSVAARSRIWDPTIPSKRSRRRHATNRSSREHLWQKQKTGLESLSRVKQQLVEFW